MNYKNMGSSDGRGEARPPETPLARQSSVYSLTFDEFQSTMGGMGVGKDFGSMNMDEFLKNIWTAEETQAMASASAAAAAAAADAAAWQGGGGAGGLQRQGSLTLPRTLSQKTVDEVWRGLVGEQEGFQQQRQPTMGEMTLEEFLVRAGVVREDNQQAPPIVNNSNTSGISFANNSMIYSELPVSNGNQGLALGFGQPGRINGTILPNSIPNSTPASLAMAAASARSYANPLPMGNAADLVNPPGMRGGGIVGIGESAMNSGLMPGVVGLGGGGITIAASGSPANQTSSDGLNRGNGDLSSLSPVPYMFGNSLRGRKHSGAVEKVVERRQKRMIKNRESAARSRARKQAYTMELEAEVAKLKEQNEELQNKQLEITEMQKNQVLEVINQHHVAKKRCLRRTRTGPW